MPSHHPRATLRQSHVPGWPEAISPIVSDAAGLTSRVLETCECPPRRRAVCEWSAASAAALQQLHLALLQPPAANNHPAYWARR